MRQKNFYFIVDKNQLSNGEPFLMGGIFITHSIYEVQKFREKINQNSGMKNEIMIYHPNMAALHFVGCNCEDNVTDFGYPEVKLYAIIDKIVLKQKPPHIAQIFFSDEESEAKKMLDGWNNNAPQGNGFRLLFYDPYRMRLRSVV